MEAESENVFSDELGLSECFTAHSGTVGAQTPINPPAAVRVNKPQVQRDVVGEELREARMELVDTYNLTEDSRKCALEQILARSPDDCDRDLLKMPAEAAALLRTAVQYGRLLEWQAIRTWRIPSSVRRAIWQHGSGRSGCGCPKNVVL